MKDKPERTVIVEIEFHSKPQQASDAAKLAVIAQLRVRPPPMGEQLRCWGEL